MAPSGRSTGRLLATTWPRATAAGAFSPDGQWFVSFWSARTGTEVALVDVRTGATRALSEPVLPSWGPVVWLPSGDGFLVGMGDTVLAWHDGDAAVHPVALGDVSLQSIAVG